MSHRLVNLTIQLPEKDNLVVTCEAIRKGKKRIKYNTLLSLEEVQQMISALNDLKAADSPPIEVLDLESAFPFREKSHEAFKKKLEGLIGIFTSAVNKVKKLKLGKNTLPEEFIKYVAERLKSEGIKMEVEFNAVDVMKLEEMKSSGIKENQGDDKTVSILGKRERVVLQESSQSNSDKETQEKNPKRARTGSG